MAPEDVFAPHRDVKPPGWDIVHPTPEATGSPDGLSGTYLEYASYDPNTKTGTVHEFPMQGTYRANTGQIAFTVDRGGRQVEKPGITIHAPYFSYSQGPSVKWEGPRPLHFSGTVSADGQRMEGTWHEADKPQSSTQSWTAVRSGTEEEAKKP